MVAPQRCDGTRPTCSTCAHSRIHADCVYEDPSPDSPPTGSVVSTTDQDNPPDARSETTDPRNITELDPPPGCEAAALETPTLASLKNFRPLLFTDYEDPLLYALSDISLEDMNMSLWVRRLNHESVLTQAQPHFVLCSPDSIWPLLLSGQAASNHSRGYLRHRRSPLLHILRPVRRLPFLSRTQGRILSFTSRSHVFGHGMGLVQRYD